MLRNRLFDMLWDTMFLFCRIGQQLWRTLSGSGFLTRGKNPKLERFMIVVLRDMEYTQTTPRASKMAPLVGPLGAMSIHHSFWLVGYDPSPYASTEVVFILKAPSLLSNLSCWSSSNNEASLSGCGCIAPFDDHPLLSVGNRFESPMAIHILT